MKATAIFGAALGMTSVIMGAASDHLFADLITPENTERLDVALRYHQLYAILIFCLGLYRINNPTPPLKWASYAFCAGTVIFCASLYASLYPNLSRITVLTPVGGLIIMSGWALCLATLLRCKIPPGN